MTRWLCLSFVLLTSFSTAAAPLTGRVTQRYEAAPEPFFLPTDVAVDADGSVAVADGVNRRIVLFDANGDQQGVISASDALPLDTPLSLAFDEAGQLWVVDSQRGALFVLDREHAPVRTIALDTDVTDVAPALGSYWAVANDRHQVVHFADDGAQLRAVGQRGVGLGQFDYPYRAARLNDGRVAVTDTINGRVVLLTATGDLDRAISRYGVQLGELYRPKGVAVDASNRIWVSDSDLGVVQCFTTTGQFVGVLRDTDGAVLRFAAPHGLAFDADGHLYVVELAAHRVVRLAITESTAAPPPQPTERISDQPRHCTACHLEWMAPLSTGTATELAAIPDNPPELPNASRSEVCLSCHDGSVADDRRSVWRDHGHTVGLAPPDGMTVSAALPLVDGKLACRTCHSAHTRAGAGNVLRDSVFLRTEGPVTTMCNQCHEHGTAAAHAGHPVGEMSIPMPAELVRHDAAAGESATITCMTCHVAHGGQYERLLSLPTSDNRLCLTCHADLAPDLFAADRISRHGQLPQLSPEQSAVTAEFDTAPAADATLRCVTCHQSHAAPRAYQLAFAADRDVCSACHSEQRSVGSTPHDLSATHGELVNRFGTQVSERGSCAACHGAHGAAFVASPNVYDPQGQCVTCHATDGVVAAGALPEHNHPDAACGDCHNPHDNRLAHFLAAPAEQTCLTCHADYALETTSLHHLENDAATWPAAAAAAGDTCLACHRPHADEQTGLWRVAAPASVGATRSCLGCHPTVADESELMPQHPAIPTDHAEYTANSCAACHDPHRGTITGLLRAPDVAGSAEACYRCHETLRNIEHIGHAPEYLTQAGFDATACRPCHVSHAAPGTTQAYMHPVEWLQSEVLPTEPESDRDCYACHTLSGPVLRPVAVTHPEAVMVNLTAPDDPAFLPLFDRQGNVDPQGQVGCKTCHVTHGRETPLPLPAQVSAVPPREARARAWHLREFRYGNVCTTCHGEDALRRFIYFHDAERRGGSVESGR
jgi:predicted CXXCH cytochrome family protein